MVPAELALSKLIVRPDTASEIVLLWLVMVRPLTSTEAEVAACCDTQLLVSALAELGRKLKPCQPVLPVMPQRHGQSCRVSEIAACTGG